MRRKGAFLVVVALVVALAACSSDGAEIGSAAPGWTRLSPAELSDLMDREDVYLVNVHVPYEGEIPGTDAMIAYTEIAARIGELPADGDRALVLYCRSGNMSTSAARDLVAAGRTGFYELEGGYLAWVAAGLPFGVTPDS